jgi:hypothetical protein
MLEERRDMKIYDDAVLEAAASRENADSPGAWRLADALLTAIPHGTNQGTRTDLSGVDTPKVPALLDSYADRLTEEGIETPAGASYSASTLLDLRNVSMLWPKDKRHSLAAFTTHQDAGGPESIGGKALIALCKYAAGGAKRKPVDIDSAAWAEAVKRVDKVRARGAKYPVTKNAIRAVKQRRLNVIPPEAPVNVPEPVTTAEAAATVVRDLPKAEREKLVKSLVTSDPETRRTVETAVRDVKSDELAKAHQRFEEKHADKRKTTSGGASDATSRTVADQPLAVLGVLIETEPMKDGMPKVVQIVSDKRDLLADDDIEYLREWSATMRRHLDILDELLKLGTGLTDEALEGLLRGE